MSLSLRSLVLATSLVACSPSPDKTVDQSHIEQTTDNSAIKGISSETGQKSNMALANGNEKGAEEENAETDPLPRVITNQADYEKVAWAEYLKYEKEVREELKRQGEKWTSAITQRTKDLASEVNGELTGIAALSAEFKYQKAKHEYYAARENECDLEYMQLAIKHLGRPAYLGRQGSKMFFDQDRSTLNANQEYAREYRIIAVKEAGHVKKLEEADKRMFDLFIEMGRHTK